MPLSHLEHFLIQTDDINTTRDWYVNVLGFREGPSPDFKFPVIWLYLGGHDIVHLTQGGKNVSENRKSYLGQHSDAISGTGVVDHIAFRCTGLRDMMEHLEENQVQFNSRMVSDQGLFQLFLIDPNGVKVELNYSNTEAQGITPELIASALPA